MNVREIINELIKQGHKVKFRERSEREGKGVRITSIDGVHYTGSSGNKEARAILGVRLSENLKVHLEKIKTPKGKFGAKKRAPIDDDIKKKIRSLQRKFKKRGLKEGMPTLRNYRYVLEHYGKEEADRLLEGAGRYVKGIAYIKNIQALIERMNNDLTTSNNSDIARARDIIQDYYNIGAPNFKDSELMDLYELLYSWEQAPWDKAKSRAVLSYTLERKSSSWK